MSISTTLTDIFKGYPRNIKKRLLRDILLILFVTSGAILAIVFFQGVKNQRDVSTILINEANQQVSMHFQSFVEPLGNVIHLLSKWGESGLLKLGSPTLLATQFQALMEIQPNIHSIALADTSGNSAFLSHFNNKWILHQYAQSKSTTSLWVNGKSVDSVTRKNENYTPETTVWFQGAMNITHEQPFFLTDAYALETTKEEGITASRRWKNRHNEDTTYVSAVSFTINDLLNFMKQLKITSNSQIFLLEKDATFLGNISANIQTKTLNKKTKTSSHSEQLLSAVSKTFQTIEQNNLRTSIKVDGKVWWLGLSPLTDANDDVWVAVVIPEDDIFEDLHKQWLRFALVVGSILFAGIIMAVFLVRKYGHQLRNLPKQQIDKNELQSELTALIQAGESTSLEFKSTMRFNLKSGKNGKEIEMAWLKAVVAFMNSDGGILLIGVDDAGAVIGIEKDNFVNEDKCRLHFKNLMNTHVGAEFTRFVQLKVVSVNNQTILIIECERVRRPVFLSNGKQEDFFIRSGPSSMKLSMSQMVKYLAER